MMLANSPHLGHNMAMLQPTTQEKPIVWTVWALHYLVQKHGQDYVLREGVVEIARGVKLLVHGAPTGRLDVDILTNQVNEMLRQCGYDPEAEVWADG